MKKSWVEDQKLLILKVLLITQCPGMNTHVRHKINPQQR